MARRALLSVSDKRGIVEFAHELVALGFEIISTGGTLQTLKASGVAAIEVGALTGYGELFGGRVKTLHPAIHGGILYRRGEDEAVAASKLIEPIDLVCVNLYPFKETTLRTDNFGEIVENIDIGGPAMVRSAAKNFKSVLIVTSPDDYGTVAAAIENGSDSYDFRVSLMVKAYEHTARYDATIAEYLNRRFDRAAGFASIGGTLVQRLRYGENPHQQGFLYEFGDFYSSHFKVLQGEASFNNLTDISSAVKIACAFDRSAICIVKHGNPCGFSLCDDLLEAWQQALLCDKLSAFGGVVAINGEVDENLAAKMNEMFIEVIVAPAFTSEAIELFALKKRLKLVQMGENNRLPNLHDTHDFKHILGGFVLQESDRVSPSEVANAETVTTLAPSETVREDLAIAWQIAALTKSNCVTYVRDRSLLAIGMGMTSRVDAALAAFNKAQSMGVDLHGSAMASEAFFPFRDSIDAAAAGGVTAIVQPGGSVKDGEVIDAANEHKIAMLFTGIRHFLH
ncbi:bifunctional purine biosynthesis protein PurH [Campylobacterota bacterium]|nr:bifunctional purine biosynthesis protein PurH [Campylobacterota bacterium]